MTNAAAIGPANNATSARSVTQGPIAIGATLGGSLKPILQVPYAASASPVDMVYIVTSVQIVQNTIPLRCAATTNSTTIIIMTLRYAPPPQTPVQMISIVVRTTVEVSAWLASLRTVPCARTTKIARADSLAILRPAALKSVMAMGPANASETATKDLCASHVPGLTISIPAVYVGVMAPVLRCMWALVKSENTVT